MLPVNLKCLNLLVLLLTPIQQQHNLKKSYEPLTTWLSQPFLSFTFADAVLLYSNIEIFIFLSGASQMIMTFLCISESHYTREDHYVGKQKAMTAFTARYKEYSNTD